LGTVAEYLQQHSAEEYFAAYVICMFFFGSSTNQTDQATQADADQSLTISQFVSRTEQPVGEQRGKLIVNPHSTSNMSVHVVTTGRQVKHTNASFELRLAHYKSLVSNTSPVIDASMAMFAYAVPSQIADWYPQQRQQHQA
jgi:hypothetical protein